jgi:hypothetical protein
MDFKVGSRVHVSGSEGAFSRYKEFFKENELEEFRKDWDYSTSILTGDYTVVATGKHHNSDYSMLYLLRGENGKIYIMRNRHGDMALIEEGEGRMKYKVGDKVKVRSDLKVGNLAGDLFVRREMAELAGKTVTISGMSYCGTRYNVEKSGYFWTDEMFEEGERKLKTWEAIKKLTDNTLLWFRAGSMNEYPKTLYYDNGIKCTQFAKDTKIDRDTYNINIYPSDEWELVPQPVSFNEARKAAIEGKKPTITLNGARYTLSAERSVSNGLGYWLTVTIEDDTTSLSTGMIDGMWTIEG